MSAAAPDADDFLAAVGQLQERDPGLTALEAGLLVAAHADIARDSRTFSRLLDIEHALVLRAVNGLAQREGLLHIEKRDGRTMRTHFTLGKAAARLFAEDLR
ncbi:hypothetical protein [Shinella sumterensis]|uniref:hypothetical protein n=1 Tax=Shinella sumterensis TaxID=1967501 RepID=UPI003F84D942